MDISGKNCMSQCYNPNSLTTTESTTATQSATATKKAVVYYAFWIGQLPISVYSVEIKEIKRNEQIVCSCATAMGIGNSSAAMVHAVSIC